MEEIRVRAVIRQIIFAEVIAEALEQKQAVKSRFRRDISTRTLRREIFEEGLAVLTPREWQALLRIVGFRIKFWQEDEYKLRHPASVRNS
jgi:hypothetical protein